MGCTDCFQTQIELNQQFISVQQAAKAYAVKHLTNVFIYREPEGWAFMEEATARSLAIQPTGGIVSRLIPTA